MTCMRADAFTEIAISCNGAAVANGTSDSFPITGYGTLTSTIQKGTGPGGTVPLDTSNRALGFQSAVDN